MYRTVLAATTAMFLATGAFAQSEPATGGAAQTDGMQTDTMRSNPAAATTATGQAAAAPFVTAQSPNESMASDLIGTSVVDPQDETIGSVDDLVVDSSGRVTAAIVGVGGFLGIGAKDVGISMQHLEPARTEGGSLQLVTMLTREDLEQAPEFASLDDAAGGGLTATTPPGTQPASPGTAAPLD